MCTGILSETTKAQCGNEKIDKSIIIKVRNLCLAKDTIKKMKKANHRLGENFFKKIHI